MTTESAPKEILILLLAKSIDCLGLPPDVNEVLKKKGLTLIGKLVSWTEPSVGQILVAERIDSVQERVTEIKDKLKDQGLSFGMKIDQGDAIP